MTADVTTGVNRARRRSHLLWFQLCLCLAIVIVVVLGFVYDPGAGRRNAADANDCVGDVALTDCAAAPAPLID